MQENELLCTVDGNGDYRKYGQQYRGSKKQKTKNTLAIKSLHDSVVLLNIYTKGNKISMQQRQMHWHANYNAIHSSQDRNSSDAH